MTAVRAFYAANAPCVGAFAHVCPRCAVTTDLRADDVALSATQQIINDMIAACPASEHQSSAQIVCDYAACLIVRDIAPSPITPRRILRFLISDVRLPTLCPALTAQESSILSAIALRHRQIFLGVVQLSTSHLYPHHPALDEPMSYAYLTSALVAERAEGERRLQPKASTPAPSAVAPPVRTLTPPPTPIMSAEPAVNGILIIPSPPAAACDRSALAHYLDVLDIFIGSLYAWPEDGP